MTAAARPEQRLPGPGVLERGLSALLDHEALDGAASGLVTMLAPSTRKIASIKRTSQGISFGAEHPVAGVAKTG